MALTALSTEQLAEFKQFGDRVSRDASFANLVAADSREAHELASRLSSTTARTDRAGATLAHRSELSERVSSAYEKGETITIDIAQDPYNLAMFMRYAEKYGGDSAAAHALMGAELARQSLRPNRRFSDGTALPTSFGQLTEQHAHQSRGVGSSINVDAQHAVDDHQVEEFRRAGRLPQRAASAKSTTTAEVQAAGVAIRSGVGSRATGFGARAEIVETDGRTLETRRSLMGQSAKQVGKDAGASFDNARDAVKDLLKK